jgi:hypothetical protein
MDYNSTFCIIFLKFAESKSEKGSSHSIVIILKDVLLDWIRVIVIYQLYNKLSHCTLNAYTNFLP